jgi:DNA repair exonuclease SbcCD ATPase subunit
MESLGELCEAEEKELADMNAANAVLKAQLEKALADVKDLQQQTSAMGASPEASKAETASAKAALSSLDKNLKEIHDDDEKAIVYTQFGVCVNDWILLLLDCIYSFALVHHEQAVEDASEKQDGLAKKCKEQEYLIKQLREELASDRRIAWEKTQIIASGKEEIEALKAEVSALEKQLKEMHEKDSMNMETMAVDKDQIEQLKARVVVLDREVEGAELVSEHELVRWKIHVKIMQYLKQVCCEQHLKC